MKMNKAFPGSPLVVDHGNMAKFEIDPASCQFRTPTEVHRSHVTASNPATSMTEFTAKIIQQSSVFGYAEYKLDYGTSTPRK